MRTSIGTVRMLESYSSVPAGAILPSFTISKCYFFLSSDLTSRRTDEIEQTVKRNLGGETRLLADLIDDGFQHRLFDIAVGIDRPA